MNEAHTPTPWRLIHSKDISGDVGITADGLPNVLAECFAALRRHNEFAVREARANAEFIVRAVNAHDALVEALQELVADYEDATGGSFPDGHPDMLSVVAKARAALAKAAVR